MTRLLLCLVLVATACTGASALAQNRPGQPLDRPLLADLDGDGANETVRARETACFGPEGESPPPCSRADSVFRTFVVEVADACGGGERAITLSREMEFVSIA